MSFLASFGLVFVLVFRPQEIWPFLEELRLLDVLAGLAALGVLVEFGRGQQKNAYRPQLPFLVAFVVSCYVSTGVAVGRGALVISTGMLEAVFMCVVMYGAHTLGRLRALLGLLFALAAIVAVVAIDQGHAEPQCMEVSFASGEPVVDPNTADGRPCKGPRSCADEEHSEADWACERLGMFGTVSTGRRVRWRGQLGDPNELSVYLGAVIPLAIGLGTGRWLRALLTIGYLGVALYAVFLSQSRGGQLVVATVFGFYLVARFGWKGALGAASLLVPVALFGAGRDEGDMESSSEERMELLYDGVRVALHNPVLGVGRGLFKDHVTRHLTAHNSYLLAAAELGLPGLFAWTGILWTSLKIPLAALRAPRGADVAAVRPLAFALLASFLGMAVGVFFLSFTYKQLLFVWFGLAGALYGALKDEDAAFEVRVGLWDYVGIALTDLALVALIFLYSRFKAA